MKIPYCILSTACVITSALYGSLLDLVPSTPSFESTPNLKLAQEGRELDNMVICEEIFFKFCAFVCLKFDAILRMANIKEKLRGRNVQKLLSQLYIEM